MAFHMMESIFRAWNMAREESSTQMEIGYLEISTKTFWREKVLDAWQLGEYVFADGKVFKGSFEGNRKNGQGRLTYPDGRIFSGNYSLNMWHGFGTLTQKNGSTLSGNWEGGLMVGFDSSSDQPSMVLLSSQPQKEQKRTSNSTMEIAKNSLTWDFGTFNFFSKSSRKT